MRGLIVEDHKDLAKSIARGLRRHAMEVELAHDGEQGLSRASSGAYDVVVLDRDLPLVHGDEITSLWSRSEGFRASRCARGARTRGVRPFA